VQALRVLYRVGAGILFAAVLVQIGAAGYGAFYAAHKLHHKGTTLPHKSFDHGFDFHQGFGYIIVIIAVVVFLLALVARLGRRQVLMALAAPALVIVAIALADGGESSSAVIGIFHPIVAFLIFGLTGTLAHHAWRGSRAWTP